MSKQTEEQKQAAKDRRDRIIAEGKCVNCGEPRNLYSHHCDVCYEEMQSQRRLKTGMKQWKPGGRGRPPKKFPSPLTKEQHKEVLVRAILHTPPSGAGRTS